MPKAVHHRKFLERRDPEDIGKQYSQAASDSLSKKQRMVNVAPNELFKPVEMYQVSLTQKNCISDQ